MLPAIEPATASVAFKREAAEPALNAGSLLYRSRTRGSEITLTEAPSKDRVGNGAALFRAVDSADKKGETTDPCEPSADKVRNCEAKS
jgi:hypothetical protein